MLSLEQFLIFEISPHCNLSREHAPACPSGNPLRWAGVETAWPLSDDIILDCCRQAYQDLGFCGQVAWHYYCEPMLEWDRLWRLIPRIKRAIPDAAFCLWTNGTRMPADLAELAIFDSVWISNYGGKSWTALKLHVADIHVLSGRLDDRTAGRRFYGGGRCLRPFNEFILDHYGNARLCCMDWRGEAPLGDIWHNDFRTLVTRFVTVRDQLRTRPMAADAPAVCRRCAYRQPEPAKLVAPVFTEIERHIHP